MKVATPCSLACGWVAPPAGRSAWLASPGTRAAVTPTGRPLSFRAVSTQTAQRCAANRVRRQGHAGTDLSVSARPFVFSLLPEALSSNIVFPIDQWTRTYL